MAIKNGITTISRFLTLQDTQLTDSKNQILFDDLLLKDGTIMRFDSHGYLDGEIEYQDGIEFWSHGKLSGKPAIINIKTGIEEDWENGELIEVRQL